MNIMKTASVGAAVVAILGAVAFVPARADNRDEAAVAIGVVAIAETPQDQVWDMTYGPDRPVAVEEQAAEAQAEDMIVDYSVG